MKMRKVLAVVLTFAIASGAFATTWTDGGSDSLWENVANWDVAVPTSGDYALIETGGTALVTGGYNGAASSMDVGLDGSGALTIDGGALAVNSGVNIGKNAGATGTITVGAGDGSFGGWRSLQSWTLTLADGGGNGTLINNGGTIKVWSEWFNVAAWGGTANVELNGGYIISEGLHMGAGGSMDIAGGSLAIAGDQLALLGGLIVSGQLTSFGVTYDATNFTQGFVFDVDTTNPGYTTISAIPEPATIAMLGIGAVGILRRKIRK